MLAKYLNFSTKHVVIDSVDNSNLKTIRPKNMSMDCTYFEKTFNVKLPTLEHELIKVKDEYITKKY